MHLDTKTKHKSCQERMAIRKGLRGSWWPGQEEGPMETGATLPANDLCQQREKAAEKCLCTWRCECEYLCAMDDVGAMTEISKWKPHIAHTLAGNTIGITTENYIYT